MNTLIIGQNRIDLNSVNSTNSYLLEYSSEEKIIEGTIVVTEEQIDGRGQRGNEWLSEPKKSLCMSILLYPKIDILHQFILNKSVSLAVHSCLKRLGVLSLIKWPNDIFVKEKKIAGILIENTIQNKTITKTIVGIGLNVNNESLIATATSLKNTLGVNVSLQIVISVLCEEIEKYYFLFKNNKDKVSSLYNENLFGKEEMTSFSQQGNTFEGVIKKVDDYGKLIVEVDGKNRLYSSGELSFNIF
ncbi:MAG: biotin--[acetyl-CoA-carboxylase] ligase [Flavobacteriales bacterium]